MPYQTRRSGGWGFSRKGKVESSMPASSRLKYFLSRFTRKKKVESSMPNSISLETLQTELAKNQLSLLHIPLSSYIYQMTEYGKEFLKYIRNDFPILVENIKEMNDLGSLEIDLRTKGKSVQPLLKTFRDTMNKMYNSTYEEPIDKINGILAFWRTYRQREAETDKDNDKFKVSSEVARIFRKFELFYGILIRAKEALAKLKMLIKNNEQCISLNDFYDALYECNKTTKTEIRLSGILLSTLNDKDNVEGFNQIVTREKYAKNSLGRLLFQTLHNIFKGDLDSNDFETTLIELTKICKEKLNETCRAAINICWDVLNQKRKSSERKSSLRHSENSVRKTSPQKRKSSLRHSESSVPKNSPPPVPDLPSYAPPPPKPPKIVMRFQNSDPKTIPGLLSYAPPKPPKPPKPQKP